MIQCKNGALIVEDLSELPDLSESKELFLDFETGSKNHVDGGLRPYHGDRICGICVTADDCAHAWYVPVRHVNKDARNVAVEPAMRWLNDMLRTAKSWVNHNVKFDAHFAAVDGINCSNTTLVDTLTLAKVLDSDRGFGGKTYSLDSLSAEWLGEDITGHENRVKNYLRGIKLQRNRKCGDYARVPIDILGEYGAQDVITNRRLWRKMQEMRADDLRRVWNTEIALTGALFDVERRGMRVDLGRLEAAKDALMLDCMKIEESIHHAVGFAVRPHVNESCFDLLCNHYGLPVLGWTEGGQNKAPEPSFDADTLVSYLSHPDVLASPRMNAVVRLIMKHREMHTLLSLFVNKYMEIQVDGIMYPFYNQAVRTGRMSCKSPNMQQLSEEAKHFIIPDEGETLLSNDYSQIEFRVIVHYIKDLSAIAAYQENPDTDFHSWVAEMCQIPRKPAKNVNFAIAFAGGKKKILTMLSSNMDLVGSLGAEADKQAASYAKACEADGQKPRPDIRKAVFEKLCRERAEGVFDTYHSTLPGIAAMTKHCALVSEKRGYVKNIVGRRRNLPSRAAWRAFNSVVQASAADIMKERFVALAPRYNSWMRDNAVALRGSVHDEFLSSRRGEFSDIHVASIVSVLEMPDGFDLRVPLRATAGSSSDSWLKAGKTSRVVNRDLADPAAKEAALAAFEGVQSR